MPNQEAATQARVDAAVTKEKQRIADVRAAVKRARPMLPDLPADYADQAVAAGRNLDQVKGDLVDLMSAISGREQSKANMLKQLRADGELPGGEAGSRNASRANMEKQLRASGVEPVTR